MVKEIEEYDLTCQKCIERKTPAKDKALVPMKITTPLIKPFQKVALDIVGPLPKTHFGSQYILIFQNHVSKFLEAFPLPDPLTTIAKVFVEEIKCRHSIPEKVLTDQGANFITGDLFKKCASY